MQPFRVASLHRAIEAEGAAALVSLVKTEGSSPREAGARLVVRPSGGFHGTIGGGELEWRALEAAREAMRVGRGPALRRVVALGPELGQCCGGRVEWRIETFDAGDGGALGPLLAAERVGPFRCGRACGPPTDASNGRSRPAQALALASPLERGSPWRERYGMDATPVYPLRRRPCRRLRRLDAGALSAAALRGALDRSARRSVSRACAAQRDARQRRRSDRGTRERARWRMALVVVMTQLPPAGSWRSSTRRCREGRFAYVGLIGSETKRARFLSQLRAAGRTEAQLATLTCPIGVPGVEGKEPAVIAASVAAQLLIARGAG